METEAGVKILFRFYSDILEQHMVETLWAVPFNNVLGHYRLDSIPFYLPDIATDDIVKAEYDEDEGMLTYQEMIQRSGNSVVWVVIMDDTNIQELRDRFFELDCISEALSDRYFAMEIKADTNYLVIKDQLNQFKSLGILDYTEPCLSEKHQY